MNDEQRRWNRLGLIASLTERAQGRPFGRTLLIKLTYLLQVYRRVYLGYRFTLRTYGPYDDDLMFYLGVAESYEAVEIETVRDRFGYGYQISPGTNLEWLKQHAADWLAQNDEAITWVMQEFGVRPASELEMVATMVFMDQAISERKERVSVQTLARRVQNVKTLFSLEDITEKIHDLAAKGLLFSLETAQPAAV